MREILHLIDGRDTPTESGATFQTLNPASTQPIARVSLGEAVEVDLAVSSARSAFLEGSWSRCAPERRVEAMLRLAQLIRANTEEIAAIESQDSGKPLAQAEAEVTSGAQFFEHFAGLASLPVGRVYPTGPGYFAYSVREPYGVVAAIAPWNFPFLLACWKTAPALAVGNSVVLKMAEQTPISSHYLGRLALEAGFPPGVLNVLHGDGATGASLVRHPAVPKITFTGSTAVGKEILRAAADAIKSVHLELGGKSPNIVFDDAAPQTALAGSLFTGFHNVGQICTSGSRMLVHKPIAADFVDSLVEQVATLKVGDPTAAETQMGPVVSNEQFERVMGYIEAGKTAGARLAIGGKRAPGAGYFIEPTVFTDVTPDMSIAQEEIFGPVLSVMTFDSEDEAVELANNVMYGLAATVWTKDMGRSLRMANRIDAGIIWTNCPHYLPLNVPYEGHKMSGVGEDLGIEAGHEFTQLKSHLMAFETSEDGAS